MRSYLAGPSRPFGAKTEADAHRGFVKEQPRPHVSIFIADALWPRCLAEGVENTAADIQ
jgi:hypothetical protein